MDTVFSGTKVWDDRVRRESPCIYIYYVCTLYNIWLYTNGTASTGAAAGIKFSEICLIPLYGRPYCRLFGAPKCIFAAAVKFAWEFFVLCASAVTRKTTREKGFKQKWEPPALLQNAQYLTASYARCIIE